MDKNTRKLRYKVKWITAWFVPTTCPAQNLFPSKVQTFVVWSRHICWKVGCFSLSTDVASGLSVLCTGCLQQQQPNYKAFHKDFFPCYFNYSLLCSSPKADQFLIKLCSYIFLRELQSRILWNNKNWHKNKISTKSQKEQNCLSFLVLTLLTTWHAVSTTLSPRNYICMQLTCNRKYKGNVMLTRLPLLLR